jgi:hypothetical protein
MSDSEDYSVPGSDTEHVMKLSVPAISGTTSRRSTRLQGLVGTHTVLILIDSGSSSNFVSDQMAETLKLPSREMPMAKVSVASG